MGKVEKSIDNIHKCLCRKCPTYRTAYEQKSKPEDMTRMIEGDTSDAGSLEGVFCASGKSRFIEERKGCICGSCQVYKENGLSSGYYCLEGTEEEQRKSGP
ncbi:DUF2769 domain-containing protein [Methanolobus chelungpuianus]|uniref:DUF2769 domain-containing protein n=1 Tax=Methanolobus chelungpuianus TaxID=502115 RepID=A0AAE3KZH4_9EURY|nr:DUF2769 domain-containing protein [Methanolobus chelungpuianus]MCQ6963409.1 hypothetical protein [Methanolobus chelungpuianus]